MGCLTLRDTPDVLELGQRDHDVEACRRRQLVRVDLDVDVGPHDHVERHRTHDDRLTHSVPAREQAQVREDLVRALHASTSPRRAIRSVVHRHLGAPSVV